MTSITPNYDRLSELTNINCQISKDIIIRIMMKIRNEGRTQPTAIEKRMINAELRNYDRLSDKARNLDARNEMRTIMRRRSENVTEQLLYHKEIVRELRPLRKKMHALRKERKAVRQIEKYLKEEDKSEGDSTFINGLQDFVSTPHSSMGDEPYLIRSDLMQEHDLISEIMSELDSLYLLPTPPVHAIDSSETCQVRSLSPPPPVVTASDFKDCFDPIDSRKTCLTKDSKPGRK